MADYASQQGGYAPYNQHGGNYGWDDTAHYIEDYVEEESPRRKLLNIVGSVASVAVVSAVVFWGYGTIVRDVSGVPVVMALEGPVRVAPEEPGGELAQNIGLSVNEVVAAGARDMPVDQVYLAPVPLDVAEEDAAFSALQPVENNKTPAVEEPSSTDAMVELASVSADEVLTPESTDIDSEAGIMALANQLAMNVTPLSALDLKDVVGETEETEAAFTAVRPRPRPPVQLASADADFVPAAPVAAKAAELDVAALASGTRLVQLGAYESPEVARSEWDRISARYSEFFDGKDRVIQRAESGGRVFYRLRVHGFADLADSRRFCAVLAAGNAACIPVAVR